MSELGRRRSYRDLERARAAGDHALALEIWAELVARSQLAPRADISRQQAWRSIARSR